MPDRPTVRRSTAILLAAVAYAWGRPRRITAGPSRPLEVAGRMAEGVVVGVVALAAIVLLIVAAAARWAVRRFDL